MSRILQLCLLCSLILLTACTTISRRLQAAANTATTNYPAAEALDPTLEKPQFIDLNSYPQPQKPRAVSIAIAASGGGYRAANLVLGVLMGLEKISLADKKHNLLQKVDYFSTVSGGGFGAGYYLTQLYNYHKVHPGALFSLNNTVNHMLAQDKGVENDIDANPLRADLTGLLFFGKDRSLKIEQRLNQTLLVTPQGGLRLGDIFAYPAGGQHLPYWVANATIYQNAEIFPFTPDILARYRVVRYFSHMQQVNITTPFTHPCYGCDMPAAVGLTASASVPLAMLPTTLVSRGCYGRDCYLQLYDGGIGDNLGIFTALSLLVQDHSKTKVLIIIDAYKGMVEPYSSQFAPPDSVPLMLRIASAITDASHANMRSHVGFVTRDVLCSKGADRVLVVYLDLNDFPAAQHVGTQLNMTLAHQKLLIKTGEALVKMHPELKRIMRGDIGACR